MTEREKEVISNFKRICKVLLIYSVALGSVLLLRSRYPLLAIGSGLLSLILGLIWVYSNKTEKNVASR